jgi:hypothetical protein
MKSSQPDPQQVQIILDGLKGFFEVGGDLNQWALVLIGGGLAVMVSSSYHSPRWPWRLMYVALLPGFGALGWALWEGSILRRIYAGAAFTARQTGGGLELLMAANTALLNQILAFQVGVGLFAVWLILYMSWWIFVDDASSQPKENPK